MEDSDSDLSSLSSALSEVDEEIEAKIEADVAATTKTKGIGRYFKPTPKSAKTKEPSPEPPKRAPSPPHEFVLADKDAIAFIVMFRSRFSDCFAKSLPHYGPQDIERGISGERPDEQVEHLLCALLSLCLNRKKPVEKGHYGRALEDAISEFKSQWPREWNGTNPLNGGKSFNTMTADERLILLKTIILWSLHASEIVNAAIKQAYKQTRRDDDKNQPKAVQPWFSDSWRRKYYLIEGQEDTHFRIYRENTGRVAKTNVWFSVAGTIDEAKVLAEKFETEMPGNPGKLLAEKIRMAVPRWEAGEEKRRRKDYRLARKAAFARPEPGFSLYEGRTRGKRMRYNYDDMGDDFEEDSSRAASGRSTPFDEGRPTVTASGRTVKSRLGGMYGESMLTDQRKDAERDRATNSEDTDDVIGFNGRPIRKSIPTKRAAASRGRYADGLESESETDGPPEPSGDEWSGNEDEPDDESEPDAEDSQDSNDELMDDADDDNTQESLVVQLRYRKKPLLNGTGTNGINGHIEARGTPLREVTNASDTNITDSTTPVFRPAPANLNGTVPNTQASTSEVNFQAPMVKNEANAEDTKTVPVSQPVHTPAATMDTS